MLHTNFGPGLCLQHTLMLRQSNAYLIYLFRHCGLIDEGRLSSALERYRNAALPELAASMAITAMAVSAIAFSHIAAIALLVARRAPAVVLQARLCAAVLVY